MAAPVPSVHCSRHRPWLPLGSGWEACRFFVLPSFWSLRHRGLFVWLASWAPYFVDEKIQFLTAFCRQVSWLRTMACATSTRLTIVGTWLSCNSLQNICAKTIPVVSNVLADGALVNSCYLLHICKQQGVYYPVLSDHNNICNKILGPATTPWESTLTTPVFRISAAWLRSVCILSVYKLRYKL